MRIALIGMVLGSVIGGVVGLSSRPAIADFSLLRLSETQVAEHLQRLPGWETDGQRLYCTYQFANFVESVSFVDRLVEPAEAVAHHPDLIISYSRVTVSLTTHDVGGLTSQDFALAQTISGLTTVDRSSTALRCQPTP